MDFSLFCDQVEKHFRYLIDKHGFSVVKKKPYDSQYAMIVLQSKECRIRVLREREDIFVHAGPPSATEEWYDLGTLIAYLTRGTEQVEFEVPDYDDYNARIEWQVKRLADIFHTYYIQICDLFRKETFDKERADLKDFVNMRFK
jgi:hypothetical protein